jgi:iturin family lipopeptide synthetase C
MTTVSNIDQVSFTGKAYSDHIKFWTKYSNKDPHGFTFQQVGNALPGDQKKTLDLKLEREHLDLLSELSKGSDTALFVCLLSTWGMVLQKYSNNNNIVVHSPLLSMSSGISPVNEKIPLFLEIAPEKNLKHLLNTTQETVKFSYMYQNYPLSLLSEQMQLSTFQSNILITFEPIHDNVEGIHDYDLVIQIKKSESGDLGIQLHFNQNAFQAYFINNINAHFINAITSLKALDTKVKEVSILSSQELELILDRFKTVDKGIDYRQCMQQVFEKQAAISKDAIAVSYGESELTYQELNKKANQLAHYLKKQLKIEKGDVVALMMPRSEWMIIGILGILKAGAVYLPIDIMHPKDRKEYMLTDAKASLLLVSEAQKDQHSDLKINTLALGEQLLSEPVTNPPLINDPEDIAYVIYTSGSTGKPKGVQVAHQSQVNMSLAQIDIFGITAEDAVLQFAPLSFDASISEIFMALYKGATLVLTDQKTIQDNAAILTYMKEQKVSVVTFTPSYLSTFNIEDLSFLRVMITAGEAANVADAMACYRHMEYFNAYGPTECAVCVSVHAMKQTNATAARNIPIGKPISNMEVCILNENGDFTPLGLMGELHVGGIGLSKGYINNPTLTQQNFVYHTALNKTLYRTGDLVRWDASGNLEYVGRKDEQLKIRGYRIEPGEIATVLRKHPSVQDAVVIKGQADELLAMIVSNDQVREVSEEEFLKMIKKFCQQQLPDYMVPGTIRIIAEIPFTINGKVDKKALLEFHQKAVARSKYVAPVSEIEKFVAGIWEAALGRIEISIQDNFFAIGGDSIKGIQIVSRIFKAGYVAELKDLYQYPTIQEFSKFVKTETTVIDQSPVTGEIPLTPIQAAFFEAGRVKPNHYNHAVMLYNADGFDYEAISAVFKKIQEHHDVLRVHFKKEKGKIQQFNRPEDLPLDVNQYDLREWDAKKDENDKQTAVERLSAIAEQLQAGIDLENGNLMKIAHFRLEDGDRLLVIIHHLVIDGISWRILSEDIEQLYQQYQRKESLTLPPKTHSYQDWAKGLHQYANSEALLKQLPYWKEAALLDWNLQKDHDAENKISDTRVASFSLDPQKTSQLLTNVHKAFFTQINDLLLAALSTGFYNTFGDEKIVIDLEGHGREAILKEININRTVGWFTNDYPLTLSYQENWGDQIKGIKESLRAVPDKGIGYGILKHLTSQENKKEYDFTKKASPVVFNYLGQFDQEVDNLSFTIAKESYGRTEHTNEYRIHELEFSGMVVEKSLKMSLIFSHEQFEEDTINRLMENYEKALIDLIDYCTAIEQGEHTLSDLSYKGLTQSQFNLLNEKYDIDDVYPLSPMQEGMLFQSQYDKDSLSYFDQTSYRVKGYLDKHLVEKSLNELLARHAALRTAFVHNIADRPLQVALRNKTINFYYENIRHLGSDEAKDTYVEEFKEKNRGNNFDFSEGSLLKVFMLQLDDNTFEFIWGYHHIIMDGWCIMILITEFLELYNSNAQKTSHRLLPVEPYSTYINWLEMRNKEQSKQYWDEYLKNYSTVASLPKMKASSTIRKKSKNTQHFVRFDSDKTNRLKALAGEKGITMNSVIQVIWGVLLSRYNGVQDVVFGTVVSGRPSQIPGIESMIGLFINTIPVRIRYKEEDSFSDLLQLAHDNSMSSEPHQYYPLADIQTDSDLKNDLIDHLLTFENYPISDEIEGIMKEADAEDGGVQLEISKVDVYDQNHYDFNILFGLDHGLILKLEYTDAYEASFIESIAGHFGNVIDQILQNENIKIKDINITSEQEITTLINEFSGIKTDYPNQATIPELFEAQVSKNPGAVALSYEGNSLTYTELNEKSNRLSNYLREEYHIAPDTMVGLLMERSDWVVISILAILKSGGAYVPIDPSLPKQNIKKVLKDTDLNLLLTHSELMFDIDYHQGSLVAVDLQMDTLPEQYDNPEVINRSSDLAYVMYTSGSTGVPKGVLVSHQNVVRLVKNTNYINLEPGLKLIPTGALSFDATTFEFWSMLLNGGQLHILKDNDLKDVSVLKSAMLDKEITTMWFTSSWFNQLADMDLEIFSKLKHLLVGGEKLSPKHINKVRKAYPELTVINGYGPTENTTFSICYPIDEEYTSSIPLGKPVANSKVYILDQDLKPVSVGIKGGIFLGGDGLSRGYLNQPMLTAERYITSPFAEGEYLYDTGDLGRWTTDGKVEFLGRSDEQVKIRGYRIEPDEIAHVMKQHPAIKDARVALAKGPGEDGQLIAAVIPEEKEAYTVKQLAAITEANKELSTYVLPNQMVMFQNNQSETAFLYEEIFENRTYDKYGVKIKEGDVIFDVGANIGMFSIYVGLHYPNTKMYAFEPLAPTFNTLNANSKLYPINLKPIHCGLSDKEQKVTFVHYPFNTVMSGKHADDSSVDKDILKGYFNKLQEDYSDKATEKQLDEMLEERMKTEYYDCTLRRLSDVMREEKVEQIDLLKVDVEKSELEVLLGIDDDDWARIKQVAMELHDIDGKLEKIKALLSKHGFEYDIEKEDVLEETHLYNIYATKRINEKATPAKTLSFDHPGNWTTADALIDDIKQHCETNLPHYMLPNDFRIVPAFPLTERGKIDIKQLMDSEGYRTQKSVEYEAPKDKVEKQLAGIWETVLEKENIGLKDNFFELGGHSLKAIQVTSQIAQDMEVKVDLASIFSCPTLEALANEIKAGMKVDFSSIEPVPLKPYYDLSQAQLRLFSVCQSEKENIAYNMPGAFVLEGNLNLQAFQDAYSTVVDRHESLRTSFIITEDGPKQKINQVTDLNPKVTYTDLRSLDDRETRVRSLIEKDAATPFDLTRAPLLRLELLHVEEEKYVLLFTMHHIISDGRSIDVLINDFLVVYDAYCQQKPNPLQPLRIQYKDFAQWQNDQLKETDLENHRAFWMENLEGPLQPLQLPTDFPRPEVKGNRGKTMSFALEKQLSDDLRKLALENEGSLFMMFSASINALLFHYTKQTDIIIGSPILGRDHIDLSNQIGYYLNTLAIRSRFSTEDTFTDLFCGIRENMVNVYKHQNYPFNALIDDLNLKLDRSRNVLFDVGLTYNVNEEVVLNETHAFGDIKLSTMSSEFGTSKADIWFHAHVNKEAIWFTIDFNTDLFKKGFMEAFVNNYIFLLEAIRKNPKLGLKQLSEQIATNQDSFLKSKQEASSKSNLDRLLNINTGKL